MVYSKIYFDMCKNPKSISYDLTSITLLKGERVGTKKRSVVLKGLDRMKEFGGMMETVVS